MLKQEVTFEDVEFITDDKTGEEQLVEVEKTRQLRFLYTVKTMKLYEQKTGRDFFDDYNQAFSRLTGFLFNSGIDFKKIKELTEEESVQLLPMLTDPTINHFLTDFIPCFYAEVKNGALVQNEETATVAEDSLWFTSLINVQFFLAVFGEVSSKDFAKRKTQTRNTKASKKS